jgi:alpha-L-rhamnosidase
MPSARAEYDSVYGKIVSDWKGSPTGPFSLRLVIPANSSAKVFLPAIAGAHVTEGGKTVSTQTEAGENVVRVGSGTYNFEVK